MGICLNLRGFVTGISIRDFCFGSLVALREKLELEVSKIRVFGRGQEDDLIF